MDRTKSRPHKGKIKTEHAIYFAFFISVISTYILFGFVLYNYTTNFIFYYCLFYYITLSTKKFNISKYCHWRIAGAMRTFGLDCYNK